MQGLHVKFFLGLFMYHWMPSCGEVEVQLHEFLTWVPNTVDVCGLFYSPTTLTHAQGRRHS